MTRDSVLVLFAILALAVTPAAAAPQATPPQPSGSAATSPAIVFNHEKAGGEPVIYTRDWENGQAFTVQIENTCPGSFDYRIEGIQTGEPGGARALTRAGAKPEDVEPLSTKTLTGQHDSKWGGYFVTIRKKVPAPAPKCQATLPDTTLIIQVTTPAWSIAFAGGFVGSGLTDPVYSLGPNPDSTQTTKIVTESPEQRDKVRLGLAAFVFVSKKEWKVVPLAFGLGVDSSNRTTYYLGPGIQLGDKAVVTGGVAIGQVSRLPNGMKSGSAVSPDTSLTTLPTQVKVSWFFGISYSFISTGDKLTKPFATGG